MSAMKQSENKAALARKRKAQAKRALMWRRIAAVPVAAAGVALFVYACRTGLCLASLLWGAAAVLLALEAAVLCSPYRVSKALQALLALGCVALVSAGFVQHFLVRTEVGYVPKYVVQPREQVLDEYPQYFDSMVGLQVLDMRGSTVTDFTPIYGRKNLRLLDLRENYAFDQAEHDALAEALPECEIRWSVPVKNAYFDSAMPEMDVSNLPLSAAEVRELLETYPEKRFNYAVPLLGQRYAWNTESLTLSGQTPDLETLSEAFSLMPSLTSVDMKGMLASADLVNGLCDAFPRIDFAFTFDVPNGRMTSDDREVTLTGDYGTLRTYMPYFSHMPNLEKVEARSIPLTQAQAEALSQTPIGDRVNFSFTAFGKALTSADTELDLDDISVSSVDAVERVLAMMPHMTRVSMCNCGLSEDDMGLLFDRHPEIKFIFWVKFGKFKLRTDATSFSTAWKGGKRPHGTTKTFQCLRYCTDLEMLDLGHNDITSLEPFKDLKKLKVLILADNKITDISEIAGLTELQYIELFMNDISDFSPLANLEHLVDLNIFYNPIKSLDPIKSITTLKRLWCGQCGLSSNDVKLLRAALPDCTVVVKGRSSTGEGWRKHPHYRTLSRMYKQGKYIPFDDL